MNITSLALEALKIGLPALLAGVATYLLTSRARAHDFAKENLRRRRDALDASMEAIQEHQDDFRSSVFKWIELAKLPSLDTEEAKALGDEIDVQDKRLTAMLSKIELRFELLGLGGCTDALREYMGACGSCEHAAASGEKCDKELAALYYAHQNLRKVAAAAYQG